MTATKRRASPSPEAVTSDGVETFINDNSTRHWRCNDLADAMGFTSLDDRDRVSKSLAYLHSKNRIRRFELPSQSRQNIKGTSPLYAYGAVPEKFPFRPLKSALAGRPVIPIRVDRLTEDLPSPPPEHCTQSDKPVVPTTAPAQAKAASRAEKKTPAAKASVPGPAPVSACPEGLAVASDAAVKAVSEVDVTTSTKVVREALLALADVPEAAQAFCRRLAGAARG